MVFASSPPFLSAHKDILSATPQALSEKVSLVEEIKHRAKASIKAQNYPEADTLYTKAIDTLSSEDEQTSSLSILYSNRSLCRFNVGRFDEAVEDAQSSISNDEQYAKGYWRLGQALGKLERYGEAKKAYQDGMARLGPKEKKGAWTKEIEKCEVAETEMKELMEGDPTKVVASKSTTKKTTVIKKSTSSSSTTSTTKKSSKSSSTSSSNDDNDDTDANFSQSDHVRGYKIVDGKKTSFFHHEQTEEERRLIGDIAPKRLDETAAATTTIPAAPEGTSVWNTAGTWEEKDVTVAAKDLLKAELLSTQFSKDDIVAQTTSVDTVEGHASVAKVRGKTRFVFEFSLQLGWEVKRSGDDVVGRGRWHFPDVDGTCNGEYEMTEFKVTEGGEERMDAKMIEEMVRKGGLKEEVQRGIDRWIETFMAMY